MNVLQGAPLDSKFCPSRTIYYEFYFLNFKVKKYLFFKKKEFNEFNIPSFSGN